ncbi:MAG: TraR/DksA family transcriptional regulator [Gammaproteobacteria bacterium]|nr:TraR/DksA family transcriptional regulator [Gammaproteobacteria bacterium]MBV8307195.1 TraR/DksA family transcriptional regulator [Gammaproteobacteria bacterium]
MPTRKSGLDAQFVEQQRQALLSLRATLVAAASGAEADEQQMNEQSDAGAVEFEDDSQRLDTLERDGALVAREVDRLDRVDRALEKIQDGTYGLSDISGEPIARERLQAVPDALYTLEEERSRERARQ